MGPGIQTGLMGNIHKDNRAIFDESTGSDGTVLRIVDGRMNSARALTTHLFLGLRGVLRQSLYGQKRGKDGEQRYGQ